LSPKPARHQDVGIPWLLVGRYFPIATRTGQTRWAVCRLTCRNRKDRWARTPFPWVPPRFCWVQPPF